MQFCDDHWQRLRTKIDESGLAGLVSPGGYEAARRSELQLSDKTVTRDSYDPLISAFWAISSNALSHGGAYLLSIDESGAPYCPLCEVRRAYPAQTDPSADDAWIQLAVDEQATRARELGLIPGVQ